jgi:hypothetical protein
MTTDENLLPHLCSEKVLIEPGPPQGIFHVHVTYAARPEADGGKFVIAVGDQEKVCEIRGTGEPVTDEYFLAVPNSGEHTLTVRAKSKPSQRLMDLKSVNLAFP